MAFSILFWSNYTAGTAKLSRKSEIAVQSDHVLKFVYDKDAQFVRGVVQASMRDRSYQVTIALGSNYNIEQSTCECVNGMDKCHHKASILLYGYKNVSKTDVRQSWIKNSKSVPPRQTKTMEELFPAPERFVNYRATVRPVDGRDREFLFNRLTTVGRFSAMHWILSPEPPVPRMCVPIIEDLISSQEFVTSDNPSTWLKQKLFIDEQQIQQIALLTIGQKDNCMWSTVRKNRLTASNFGVVLAAIKRNRYPISLYKRLCSAYDLSKKDAIIWGMCNEKVAVEKYRTFGDAIVEPTGIWLHHNGILGSSPDGIIRRPAAFGIHYQHPALTNIVPEVLEVKCPFSAKDMTIAEAIENIPDFYLVLIRALELQKNKSYMKKLTVFVIDTDKCKVFEKMVHLLMLFVASTDAYGIPTVQRLAYFENICFIREIQDFSGLKTFKLRENHPYYHQVQGQLHVMGKSACDFIVWTRKDCAIVRIPRDSNWEENISALTDFYFRKFIPHLQQL